MIQELNEFFENIPEEHKETYMQLADYAMALGYKPKRAKTKDINYVFMNNKMKKHVMKFSINKCGEPSFKMKFYASATYPELFHEAIRKTIEEFDYKYTGCYRCGKCDGSVGYTYTYPDGRSYFRCNGELIDLGSVQAKDVQDIIALLKTQHEYYLATH